MPPLNNWGTPGRDTAHDPNIELQIDLLVDTHPKMKAFFSAEGLQASDYEAIRQRMVQAGDTGENSESRIRTWRKVFENVGLVYVNHEGKITLTPFGTYVHHMEESSRKNIILQLADRATATLKKYQLRNPANSDNDNYPADCDIFPYWCIWRAMTELEGKLHHEELNRVLLKVMRTEDLPAAIQRIATARQEPEYNPADWDMADRLLGERAFGQDEKNLKPGERPQAVNRMLPWLANAGFGGLLIESDSRADGFRYLNEETRAVVQQAVAVPPVFRTFGSKQDWFAYYGAYGGNAPEEPESPEDIQLKERILQTCRKHGGDSFIILTGVPATGKTRMAKRVALALVDNDVTRLGEVQFHESYSYEDFVEGYVPKETGGFKLVSKVFRTINRAALDDPNQRTHVLLIEEFSRAKLTNVLGELLTYVEHRGRRFRYPLSGDEEEVAGNLIFLGTMNPLDRSVLEMDDALLRRIRQIEVGSDGAQLRRMLEGQLPPALLDRLVQSFEAFKNEAPFGHGVFASVRSEEDLHELWVQRLRHLLIKPSGYKHPAYEIVVAHYPWRGEGVAQGGPAGDQGA